MEDPEDGRRRQQELREIEEQRLKQKQQWITAKPKPKTPQISIDDNNNNAPPPISINNAPPQITITNNETLGFDDLKPMDRARLFISSPPDEELQIKARKDTHLQILSERAQHAQYLEDLLGTDNPSGDGVRGFLGNPETNPRGFRPKGFNQLFTKAQDLDAVGSLAWDYSKLIEKNNNQPGSVDPKELQDMQARMDIYAQSQHIDPTAREVARQFSQYLPIYDQFLQGGKQPIELPNGDVISLETTGGSQGKSRAVIRNSNGEIVLKPGEADDPRGFGVVTNVMRDYLSTDTRDSAVTNTLNGGQHQNVSLMMKGVYRDFGNSLYKHDPERVRNMVSNYGLIHDQAQHDIDNAPKPEKEGKKKKKKFGFNLFNQ